MVTATELKVHNENLPIFLVHIKVLPWKFRILNPKNSRVIDPSSLWNVCL